MTKEMGEALKSVFDIIVRENPNAIRATIEFKKPGLCTVVVKSKDGILLRRL